MTPMNVPPGKRSIFYIFSYNANFKACKWDKVFDLDIAKMLAGTKDKTADYDKGKCVKNGRDAAKKDFYG